MKFQNIRRTGYYILLVIIVLGIIGISRSIIRSNYWRTLRVEASIRNQQIIPRTLVMVEKSENEKGEKIFHRITKAVRSDGAEYEGREIMDASG